MYDAQRAAEMGGVLDIEKLIDDIAAQHKPAFAITDVDEIVKRLTAELRSGDVVAIMSNGAFGGIHEKFLAVLSDTGNPVLSSTSEETLRVRSKHRVLSSALLLVPFTLISSLAIGNSALNAAAQPRKNTVVFAVAGEPDDYHLDAVVVVDGKQLRLPYTDEDKARQKKFGEEYFAEGRTYRLTFGGGDAGSVKVKKWSEGCNSIHAEVSVLTSARLGGHVDALATNSDALGKRASARRAPTDAERAAVMVLVKSIYSQNHTPLSLIPSIKVTNLTATDLDGDGKFEFIGSFTSAAKNKFERDLFLIAKSQGTAMRADFIKFQPYQPPPEGFLSSINFVDQLDLDGDGVGEVFAMHGGFDAYGYLIFKKAGGRWRQVFEGIGDAC